MSWKDVVKDKAVSGDLFTQEGVGAYRQPNFEPKPIVHKIYCVPTSQKMAPFQFPLTVLART